MKYTLNSFHREEYIDTHICGRQDDADDTDLSTISLDDRAIFI